MIVYVGLLLVLTFIAFLGNLKTRATSLNVDNEEFKTLQAKFFIPYFLAMFSDWLHGPYVYKLYSDYGYNKNEIAVLYVVGFATSSLSGTLVGHVADNYGRKYLCASFGIIFSLCGLMKLSPNFYSLFLGRMFGGIATAILFTIFESWYVNEHLNFLKLPPEWLHSTFSKAAFYNGLLAIMAGILSHFFAEVLNYGSVAPFLLAIPFLLFSTCYICFKWEEHPLKEEVPKRENLTALYSLKFMFCEERILLLLGSIQMCFETVMYIFVFSWTPVLDGLDPPLGLVFSIFMVSLMNGSKIYELLIYNRYKPETLLMATCALGLFCFSAVSILTSTRAGDNQVSIFICFLCFVIYEFSVGIYSPVMGYLRGRIIAEEYRASVVNWLRFPMNILTCVVLLMINNYEIRPENASDFSFIFHVCSVTLLLTTIFSMIFSKRYIQRMEHERMKESENGRTKKIRTIKELSSSVC